MKALLPEFEDFLSRLQVEDGSDLIYISIYNGVEEIVIKKLVMRKYAMSLQTVANIIGIRVVLTEVT